MKVKYGRIVIYKMRQHLAPGTTSRLFQKLLGYEDKSNFGKYTYQRRKKKA